MVILPLPASTASLKVRARFAVEETDPALSTGKVESSVGAAKSGGISDAAVRVPSKKVKYSTPETVSRPISGLLSVNFSVELS